MDGAFGCMSMYLRSLNGTVTKSIHTIVKKNVVSFDNRIHYTIKKQTNKNNDQSQYWMYPIFENVVGDLLLGLYQ